MRTSALRLSPYGKHADIAVIVLSRIVGRRYLLQYVGQHKGEYALSAKSSSVMPDDMSNMLHPFSVNTDDNYAGETVEQVIEKATGNKFFLIRTFSDHKEASLFLQTHLPDHLIYKTNHL